LREKLFAEGRFAGGEGYRASMVRAERGEFEEEEEEDDGREVEAITRVSVVNPCFETRGRASRVN
jgi:hypothetical protein